MSCGRAAAAGDSAWSDVATPLRIVNLNPFHLLYGVPGSFGARVLTPGSSELIASMDMASHLIEANSGAERILIDGETYRHSLACRRGFRDRWEYLFEVSAVAHRAGAFDGFIENWHDVFHLPQGDRDSAPRDRLAVFYADGDRTYVDIGRDVFTLGDIGLGVGYSLPHWPLSNDGLAIRTGVKLPTGDESSLAGSGGYSASVWAETSGALPGSAASRAWLYAATVGVLAGEASRGLPDLGGRFIAFGRVGVTWRPLKASEPDGAARCPFLALRRLRRAAARRPGRHDRPRRRVTAHGTHDARSRRHRGRRPAPRRARHRVACRPALETVVPPTVSSQLIRNRATACS